MLRLFLALNFFLLNIYACQGGFKACKLKIKHSSAIKNTTIQIPVLKNKRLIFTTKIPNKKIIKHDPFLCLYLVEDNIDFKYPFKFNMKLSLESAIVDSAKARNGKIISSQIGINKLALYSKKAFTPALFINSCCSLEGIVTPLGIIEKDYLKRFINNKSADYSDIGIRVRDEKKLVLVNSIDPFMKNNNFKKGDCILQLDDTDVKNSSVFMKKILFSNIGSNHRIKIKRDSKIISFKMKTKKRYGGGYISDTYLEQKGIFFDKNLIVTKIKNGYKDYGLKVGDKLLKVNNTIVKTQEKVRESISDFNKYSSLLFERNDFQFFVSIID